MVMSASARHDSCCTWPKGDYCPIGGVTNKPYDSVVGVYAFPVFALVDRRVASSFPAAQQASASEGSRL